jgi:hypothetical protein
MHEWDGRLELEGSGILGEAPEREQNVGGDERLSRLRELRVPEA